MTFPYIMENKKWLKPPTSSASIKSSCIIVCPVNSKGSNVEGSDVLWTSFCLSSFPQLPKDFIRRHRKLTYIYIYIYIYTYIHIHIYIYTYIRILYIYTYIHIHTYIHTYVYYTYIYMVYGMIIKYTIVPIPLIFSPPPRSRPPARCGLPRDAWRWHRWTFGCVTRNRNKKNASKRPRNVGKMVGFMCFFFLDFRMFSRVEVSYDLYHIYI